MAGDPRCVCCSMDFCGDSDCTETTAPLVIFKQQVVVKAYFLESRFVIFVHFLVIFVILVVSVCTLHFFSFSSMVPLSFFKCSGVSDLRLGGFQRTRGQNRGTEVGSLGCPDR